MKALSGTRPSPAMVLAVLALVFAMVGTAVAGPDAISSKITKSKVKSIAKKQANKAIDKRESGLNVNSASTAGNATNADAVEGNVIRKINLRAASPVAAGTVILDLAGLQLTATCPSGGENVNATTTVADGEISSISTDASNDDIKNVIDDDFAPGDNVDLTDAGPASDRIYNINYSGGDGRNVTVQLVTEDSIGGLNCIYTGFATGG